MIYGPIWAHMGSYLWPEMKKNQVKQMKNHISDHDFFLGLVQGDIPKRTLHTTILNEPERNRKGIVEGALKEISKGPYRHVKENFKLISNVFGKNLRGNLKGILKEP